MSRRSRGIRSSVGHPVVLWGSAIVAGLWVVSGLVDSASASSTPSMRSIAAVRGLAAEAGLSKAWGDFFALVATRESKGNPQALNDSASEADAAAKAYERNRHRYAGCGHPQSAYTFGSGGWFGLIPANALAQLGKAHRCMPPSSVFDPRAALAMSVGFARGLMGWEKYQRLPTWLNLRAMWGAPAKGGDLAYLAKKRPNYEKDAADVDLSPSWLDGRPPPLQVTGAEVLARLRVA